MWYTVCVNAMMKFAHAHKRSKERPPWLKAVVRALRAFRFGAGRVKATDDRAPVAIHGGAVIRQKESRHCAPEFGWYRGVFAPS